MPHQVGDAPGSRPRRAGEASDTHRRGRDPRRRRAIGAVRRCGRARSPGQVRLARFVDPPLDRRSEPANSGSVAQPDRRASGSPAGCREASGSRRPRRTRGARSRSPRLSAASDASATVRTARTLASSAAHEIGAAWARTAAAIAAIRIAHNTRAPSADPSSGPRPRRGPCGWPRSRPSPRPRAHEAVASALVLHRLVLLAERLHRVLGRRDGRVDAFVVASVEAEHGGP
mgnify:CR=1 FL=1